MGLPLPLTRREPRHKLGSNCIKQKGVHNSLSVHVIHLQNVCWMPLTVRSKMDTFSSNRDLQWNIQYPFPMPPLYEIFYIKPFETWKDFKKFFWVSRILHNLKSDNNSWSAGWKNWEAKLHKDTKHFFVISTLSTEEKKTAGITICYTENEYTAVNVVTSLCSINRSEFNIVQI